MRRLIFGLCGVLLVLVATTPSLAQRSAAMTLIVQGISGPPSNPLAPMDILIDDSMCLGAFEFGQILGPFPFEGRPYRIAIGPANSAVPCGQRPVVNTTVTFNAGEVSSLVAFASVGSRGLNLEKFTVERPGRIAGGGVVSLHHTAMAPPLDFLLESGLNPGDDDGDDDDDDDMTPVFWPNGGFAPLEKNTVTAPNMINGDQVTIAVATGKYSTSVTEAGSSVQMFAPIEIEVLPNTVKFLFAIGSMAGQALRVIEYDWPMNPELLDRDETLYEQIEADSGAVPR